MESTPRDKVNIQSPDPFDSPVNLMLIPTIVFHGASDSIANEDFNDSLENQSNDFNVHDLEIRPLEPNAIDHDSLDSIENNISTATNADATTASPSNVEESFEPKSNENNEIVNTFLESNIAKAIDTECKNDSGEYDLEDIPGIEPSPPKGVLQTQFTNLNFFCRLQDRSLNGST